MRPEVPPAELLRKSRLAFGVALICLLAAAETVVAHHAQPNPLSVGVWAVLGSAAGAALVAALWLRRRWQQALRRQARPAVKAAHPADAQAGTAPP